MQYTYMKKTHVALLYHRLNSFGVGEAGHQSSTTFLNCVFLSDMEKLLAFPDNNYSTFSHVTMQYPRFRSWKPPYSSVRLLLV